MKSKVKKKNVNKPQVASGGQKKEEVEIQSPKDEHKGKGGSRISTNLNVSLRSKNRVSKNVKDK